MERSRSRGRREAGRGGALAGLVAASLLSLAGTCQLGTPPPQPEFETPAEGFLTQLGPVSVALRLPPGALPSTLSLELDDQPLAASFLTVSGDLATGALAGVPAGRHELVARLLVDTNGVRRQGEAVVTFALADFRGQDDCDVLNLASCVLPFPSSRFLVPDASTATGLRVAFGANTLPGFFGRRLDPAPYAQNDGFSPTAQILMHFPGGMDPARSGAPRLDPQTGLYGAAGRDPLSPTLLVDWETGEPVNHWIENDARATDPARVLTFLRPAESLVPGRRYIVAARRLLDAQGNPVPAEPAFAAIRDGAPSDVPLVEARRAQLEPVLARLGSFEPLKVKRSELVLAFDFVVQSDHSLTHEMLAMRDSALAWLDAQIDAGASTFTAQVTEVNPGCTDPTQPVWREVSGTFQVPLYLERDPYLEPAQVASFVRDAQGEPQQNGFTDAPYGVSIPCSVFDASGDLRPLPALLGGHGLFGDGAGFVQGLSQAQGLEGFGFVVGGTNWAGLSNPDIEGCRFGTPLVLDCFIVKVLFDLNQIEALADRLRQGQLAALVLGRMLRRGAFNVDPAFQDAAGQGVIDPDEDLYYFGASLGGIMGTMYAALSPDAKRLNVDVPAINFSLLLQRAGPFLPFDQLLGLLNPDEMDQATGISLIHEIWVRGEPAGYATHVTRDPFPGTPVKNILMTVALYDQQVTNLGSLLAGNTLRLPNLEGSVFTGLPGMPDAQGPQDSAFVVYDTGSFDPANPAHRPFIPPPVNRQPTLNRCDPHGRRGFIPASIQQLLTFLQPFGRVENFCDDDGVCNASEPHEIPFGDDAPCDPLA